MTSIKQVVPQKLITILHDIRCVVLCIRNNACASMGHLTLSKYVGNLGQDRPSVAQQATCVTGHGGSAGGPCTGA